MSNATPLSAPSDVIWALDTRERMIACPRQPQANAVVLYLADDGQLHRDVVETWAGAGVMVAHIVWPGAQQPLTADDRLDLEDACTALTELAATVAVIAEPASVEMVRDVLSAHPLAYLGAAEIETVLPLLQQVAPV